MAEYLKWIRAKLVCAADATLYSVDLPMPVQRGHGRGMNLAVVIHRIEVDFSNHEIMADGDYAQAFVTKSTPSSTPDTATADLIHYINVKKDIVTSGAVVTKEPYIEKFDPPILVPNEKLVFSAAHNIGSSTTFGIRIGYTIRAVSTDEMYAALNNQ